MSLDTLMTSGRDAAERLMTDECRVTKAEGMTIDPDTGQSVPQVTEVYAGRCKVQTSGGVGGDTTDTGTVVNEWLTRVDFPWATRGIGPDMVVEITESGDPNLVGHRFRLVSPQSQKTHATAQRWNVKEAL